MSVNSQEIPVAYQDAPLLGTFEAAVSVAPPSQQAITLRKRKARNRYYLLQILATGLPMAVADLLALVLVAVSVALVMAPLAGLSWSVMPPLLSSLAPLLLISYAYCGLYPGMAMGPISEFRQLTIGTSLAFLLYCGGRFAMGFSWPELGSVAAMWVGVSIAAPALRNTIRPLLSKTGWWGQPVIVTGKAPHSTAVFHNLREQRSLGLRPIGVVDAVHRQWYDDYATAPYLGPLAKLGSLCQNHRAFWVIAVSDESPDAVLASIDRFAPHIPNVVVSPIGDQIPTLWSRSQEVAGRVGFHFHDRLSSPLHVIAKRLMDVGIGLTAGILISPLLLMVSLAIRYSSSGPIFYSALRIGRDGRRFRAWKFRTMVQDADAQLEAYLEANPELREEWEQSHKLKDDPRIIKGIGWFLRKSSLDEIPQLWNVLRGEMSLIGPRPIVDEEIVKYGDDYKLYCRVLPGMSGLWQVSGRNHTTYERRVELDSYYVRNWSPWLDAYILVRTVKTVLFCEGRVLKPLGGSANGRRWRWRTRLQRLSSSGLWVAVGRISGR